MKIKILFMDVDGTLTDGGIYMGPAGEVCKRFNIKDGYGINTVLKANDIIPAIVTGRRSAIVENRCAELGITECLQGSTDKVADCMSILKKYGMSTDDAAYIGDDNNDLDAMKCMRIKGCPADASEDVKSISDFISSKEGGRGAVREFIEWITENDV